MQRLIFINRFFCPDHSATSQMLSDLAFHLAGIGNDVRVVTGTQIYGDPKTALPRYEILRRVRVHRVASTRFGRAGLFGRLIDYLSFHWSAWRCLKKIVQPGDIVVAKTDPPLVSVVAIAAARRNGARLINWLQDVYPEIAVRLGVPGVRGPAASVLAAVRNRSLRQANANVVVGHLMGRTIMSFGVPARRIHVIPNWCADDEIKPLDHAENPLRRAWGLENKFVVGYSGNLGKAHEFGTVLAAAERLHEHPRILFLMIGGGGQFHELARTIKVRRLDSLFRFVAYQERKMLSYSLAAPDIHWISLNPALEGLIVPSKFYGIAAAGKPMIVIAAKDGELAKLVLEHRCGVVISPGDGGALACALLRLSNDAAGLGEMGRRARAMLEAHFTRAQGLARWVTLLSEIK